MMIRGHTSSMIKLILTAEQNPKPNCVTQNV